MRDETPHERIKRLDGTITEKRQAKFNRLP